MWSDKESTDDYLNYSEVSDLAIDVIKAPGMLPVSIGIFGNWGAGKSTLLNLIQGKLESDTDSNYLIVNFDAWLYQGYDDARVSLLEVIANQLKEASKDDEGLTQKITALLSRINIFRVMGLVGEGYALANGIPTAGLISKLSSAVSKGANSSPDDDSDAVTEGLAAVEDIGSTAKGMFLPGKARNPSQQIDQIRAEYSEILDSLNRPLVVIIDNLDRCLPEKAIQTLEAIRLFLFLPNTVFLIAADEEMIRGAVSEYFKHSNGNHPIFN